MATVVYGSAMLLACETVARTASACVMDAGRELAYCDLAGGESEQGLVALLDGLIRAYGAPSALAIAAGPGSFTGLRVGISALRTLAWLDNLTIHPVDSLAARAVEAGDGVWWVLLPLKKDTTFHGLFAVTGSTVETLQATVAAADAYAPVLHPDTARAIAIGPALTTKPQLAAQWCPGIACGSPAGLTARGVARLAPSIAPVAWDRLLPDYHQEPAPVLQRRAGIS
jgi:tRNA threonylcarbamoyl adenosine modification protein YeaZ